MKILITGVDGQLGQTLMQVLSRTHHELYGVNRPTLDITNKIRVSSYLDRLKPDVIVHCAAFTNVDGAEKNKGLAYEVNVLGTKYIAQAAGRIKCKFVYISTDYVFDGEKHTPYNLVDRPNPLSIYGETKLAGEHLVTTYTNNHFIIRTSWIFGKGDGHFIAKIRKIANLYGEVRLVSDQFGSPTCALDLANFIAELIETDQYGLYHVTNEGICSWYEFAVEFFKGCNKDIKIIPLTTEEFPQIANRPKYSVLSKDCIILNGLKPLRHWKEALKEYKEQFNSR